MPGEPDGVHLELFEADDVDEVVLAFRAEGDLHELATLEPPVRGSLKVLSTRRQTSDPPPDP